MENSGKEAVLLIGHGGVPTDAPGELIKELKMLEGQRQARGIWEMSAREAELDRKVRTWPRTPQTDPYKWGLEAVAEKLKSRVAPRALHVAYNEFCAPSVEEAIASLVSAGYARVRLVTTMFTRGGIHSEKEIPQIVEWARKKYPQVAFEYAWPYDNDRIADFLSGHLQSA